MENGLKGASHSVHFPRLTTVQSYDLHSISRPHAINIVVIAQDIHGCRSLTFRYVLRQLLYFNELFISEITVFMNELESFP